MAKNYTFAEACAIINKGTDIEAIADIGRRYPILLHKVTQVTASAGDKFVDLMSYMPDYLTANKVNTALKNTGSSSSDESDDTDDTDSNETATDDAEPTSEAGGMPDYDSMSAKELWNILGKAGKRKTAKSTKKADLVAACKAMHDAGSDDDDTDDDDAESTEPTNPYDGKSAMELFKLCKERGIKAAPKKPATFYADLLTKADAEASSTESDDGDNWDDDDTEAEEPKAKPSKKSGKAGGNKKSAKKTTSDNDGDDDDWDI